MVSSFFCVVIKLIVYVDILFVINTLINYFILLAVNRIGRTNTTRIKILLGALIGGASSVLLLFEDMGIIITILKILSSFLMIGVAFGFKPVKKFIKSIFWTYIISVILGGLLLAIYLFTETDLMIYSNGIVYFDIDMTMLIICSVIVYLIITLVSRLTDKKAPQSKEYFITICGPKGTVYSKGLMDTGNGLREPFSDYPVILADKEIVEKIFNKNEKTRLIPAQTVNKESILKAYKPHFIEINGKKTDKVYIAESETVLDNYKIILNINFEGEFLNE